MRIQQRVTPYEKTCKWKTGLIDQAKESKVVYLSADCNVSPLLEADFHLYVEYYIM